jgi:hypothetical protein
MEKEAKDLLFPEPLAPFISIKLKLYAEIQGDETSDLVV